ncbi:RNA-processing protein, HAT helix [Cinnamomum micranthum f. kanehirae]|uniref:RNA-processing protein, HAT helix n=1 Tax=Cinnamomum micranthum f. kanehirae TaxID=337451 RepID=A0A3S3PMX5_9MAGN|nr:RNA-processing protein, HAT helix [Cinnamomum micranthum f. kanehirae]
MDTKKARLLFKSITKTNPKHPAGWIGAARLEEAAGDMPTARQLIQKGCKECPKSGDVWLEACKLANSNKEEARARARMKLSKEPAIWITAAKLGEANGNTAKVGEIRERGIHALQGVFDREGWLMEPEAAEQAGSVVTCQAIIRNAVCIGVEVEDQMTWVADAEECEERASIETARAIYDHALSVFPTKTNESVWLKAAQLEKNHGTRESLDALLTKAVICMPHAEVLWLMGAKEKSLLGNLTAARAILQEAHASIPNSE